MSSSAAAGQEILECSVCLDEISNPDNLRITTCRHSFHSVCLYQALNAKILETNKATCPNCRSEQQVESVRDKITDLCDFILDQDIISAQHLLADPEVQRNINIVNRDDMHTALYRAIDSECIDLIDPLLDVGALLTVSSPGKPAATITSPIALACLKCEEIVTKVLHRSTKEQLDEPYGEFGSALNTFLEALNSAEWDPLEVLDMLLKKGADVNLPNTKIGITPLHKAILWNSDGIFNRLIQANPNPNILANGNTPLRIAIEIGQIKYVQPLIDLGADITLCSAMRFSALHYACIHNLSALKILLQKCTPEQLNRQNEIYDSALNTLLQYSHLAKVPLRESIQLLLDHGADLDLCSLKTGFAPIHHAIVLQQDELLLYFLQNHANPNKQNDAGVTALKMAVETQNVSLIWALLEYKVELAPEIIEEIESKVEFAEITRVLKNYQAHLEQKNEGRPGKVRRIEHPEK